MLLGDREQWRFQLECILKHLKFTFAADVVFSRRIKINEGCVSMLSIDFRCVKVKELKRQLYSIYSINLLFLGV